MINKYKKRINFSKIMDIIVFMIWIIIGFFVLFNYETVDKWSYLILLLCNLTNYTIANIYKDWIDRIYE